MDGLSTVAQAFAGLTVGGYFLYQFVTARRNGTSSVLSELKGLRADFQAWIKRHDEDDRERDRLLRSIKDDTSRTLDMGR